MGIPLYEILITGDILKTQNLAGQEIKIPYLGHCYRKAEAGKRGEDYTHHHNRSPSKGEKISKSNNVQDQQFLLHFADFAVPVPFIYSFSKKLLLPYFHFPNVCVWQRGTHTKAGMLF